MQPATTSFTGSLLSDLRRCFRCAQPMPYGLRPFMWDTVPTSSLRATMVVGFGVGRRSQRSSAHDTDFFFESDDGRKFWCGSTWPAFIRPRHPMVPIEKILRRLAVASANDLVQILSGVSTLVSMRIPTGSFPFFPSTTVLSGEATPTAFVLAITSLRSLDQISSCTASAVETRVSSLCFN